MNLLCFNRWHPVVPIGLPHQVTVDDEYNGMRIPKGAMIIANTRSITWDETKFKDARLYKPGRFLPKPEGDGEIFPAGAVFGWGRRSVHCVQIAKLILC